MVFLKVMLIKVEPRYIEEIEKDFNIVNVLLKPYATCADFHGAIRLVLNLQKEHNIKAEDVERVWIGVDSISKKYDSKEVETLLHAQMHYSIAIAIVLLKKDGFFDAFLRKYQDPKVKEIASRINIVLDPEVDKAFPQKWGVKVEITTKGGKKVKAYEEDRPKMSEEEVKNKFRRLSGDKLDKKAAENIIKTVDCLETIGEISDLMSLLRPK